jgi:sugar phosphate isomerase/epimerase
MFRLGATSYVIQGDLVANATHLAGQVNDMELVLFDLEDGTSNLPDRATVRQLAQIGRDHNLSYTVHLPCDVRHTPNDGSLALAEKVIALTSPLQPIAWVFHLEGTNATHGSWLPQAFNAIEKMISWVNNPKSLALENLENYAVELLQPIYDHFPIGRTLDIGHLWKQGRDPLPILERYLSTTQVVHLHGMTDRDHQSLVLMPISKIDSILRLLKQWNGVLTLEVFEDDFISSRDALLASLERIT